MHKNLKIDDSGFSLIELMGSIVIIGILSGILIIYNQSAVTKAVDTKVKTFANSVPITLSGSYVAAWKFDQINSPTTNLTPDAWGANDCTLSNSGAPALPALQTTGCPFNNCLQFASPSATTGNYLDCGNSSDFNLTKYFTFEAWIYRTSDIGSHERILSKSGLSGSPGYDYWFQVQPADTLQVGIVNSSAVSKYLNGNVLLGLNKWYHIVAAKDATNFYLYVDGVLDASGITGGAPMDDARITTSNLCIGRLGSATTWYYSFNGSMDDVRIYNDALKIGQIQQDYLAGLKKLLAAGQISQAEYAARVDALDQDVAQK
jgi:prepilin-type N-terminal cleavage/methylation domain-containing protein